MNTIESTARRVLDLRRTAIERALLQLSSDARLRELAETCAALARIDCGSYGRCESCGAAIGRQRLLALPAVRFCMDCAPRALPGP